MNENQLYHHGIKGQKWGIRRYQNKDGTLTEEGKRRLEAYREKELVNVSKYYDKKIRKLENKLILSNKDRQKLQELTNDRLQEIKHLKILDYAGMKKEQYEVGKQFTKLFLGSLAANTAAQTVPIKVKSFHASELDIEKVFDLYGEAFNNRHITTSNYGPSITRRWTTEDGRSGYETVTGVKQKTYLTNQQGNAAAKAGRVFLKSVGSAAIGTTLTKKEIKRRYRLKQYK